MSYQKGTMETSNVYVGARKIVKGFRSLALAEDLGVIPSTHMVAHNHNTLFSPLQASGMYAVHIHKISKSYTRLS